MSLEGKRIVLLSDSGAIPSLYVRFLDPIRHLSFDYNIVSTYLPGAEAIAEDADLLIVHRWFGHWVVDCVDRARLRGVPVVYEADDNLLDLAAQTSLVLSDKHRRDIEYVLTAADLVIASTHALGRAFGAYNWSVEVLENYGLDKDMADLSAPPHLAVVNSDYFKLDATKAGFFGALERAITELGYRITFFGTVDPTTLDLKRRYPDRITIVEGFVDDRSAFLDILLASGINVGIVPLSDTRQHSYKSDIKFLDFASIGVPAIYNNATVYPAVRHRVDGFMCRDDLGGWFAGLAYLAMADQRRSLGLAARRVVQDNRSIEHYARRMGSSFARLLGTEETMESAETSLNSASLGEQPTIGLFWSQGRLYVLHRGKRRHIAAIELVPALIEAGLGYVEPGEALRQQLLDGPPITTFGQVSVVAHDARGKATAPAPSGRSLRIAWIVPQLIIGGGGHRNIIRCAYHLEQLGHQVSLHFIGTSDSGARTAELVREHFYPIAGYIDLLDARIGPVDFLIATHWSTVAFAERYADRAREVIYFVQDFEPSFYAMGSEYVLAEATYRKGYYAITSGIWCEEFLRERYGCEADHFQFPIDRTTYFVGEDRRKRRVIFFAKPEMPRRCYEVGVAALRHFHQLRPDIEIAFYGSAHAQSTGPGLPVTQLGVLPGPADLAELYRTSLVGIVFSTTNPSLVPYEMMACGLPVLDMGRPGNELNYDRSQDIARLANPDPERMAQELAAMVMDERELSARSARGIAFTDGFPTEEDVGRRIEGLLLARATAWTTEGSRD